MEMAAPRVRQNFLANMVAAIASFLIEAGWYSYFTQTWLNGIGRSSDWLQSMRGYLAWQEGTAIVAAFVMATAISCVTQLTGAQTVWRGMKAAALLWLGFVVTALATDYVFEVRAWSFFGVTVGFWFVSMIAMGAIVGGWRKK